MSCNCNAKYDNKVPCCCSTGEPVICTTTVCPDAQPCYNTVQTDCVIYTGDSYDCAGIYNSMTITEVMNVILNAVNLVECTTTTTAPPTCDCYLVINTSDLNDYDYTRIVCEVNNPITLTLLPNQRIYTCSFGPITVSDPSVTVQLLPFTEYYCSDRGGTCFNPISYCHTVVVTGSVNIEYINANGILSYTGVITSDINLCAWENTIKKVAGAGSIQVVPSIDLCLSNNDCSPSAARCTGGAGDGQGMNYFAMEKGWYESSYTFTLNSMILDGVEYASGQTITIDPLVDLVLGSSPVNGGIYVMNINDWLNTSIPGVNSAGWIFYDNMHVIDKPTFASTYYIEIGRLINGLPFETYFYTSAFGFAWEQPDNVLGEYTCEETVSIYSQVISFATPMNSIIYNLNGAFFGACYGTNQTNLTNLVNMFNSNPPVQNNSCFLGYGSYFNNGDGRVRLEMPLSVYNAITSNGSNPFTIEVIYD